MTRALILVDIQNDFLPTGALPVPDGDAVVAVANTLLPRFALTVATQDWHPAEHQSFAANHPARRPGEVIDVAGLRQILWPVHCVQDTPGAAFAPALRAERLAHVVRKGTDPTIDSYSGFFDNGHRKATGLHAWLQQRGVRELFIAGLATDYCVRFTALDARQLGYATWLVADGCRGVNLQPGDVARALDALQAAGVRLTDSRAVPGE
jgi:nicotinamidase/pyrazinamidase